MITVAKEKQLARSVPDPQVEESADRLLLWNYPVGDASVALPFQAALRRFLTAYAVGDRDAVHFLVTGRASPTGEASANVDLAEHRAAGVVSAIRDLGFGNVETQGLGSGSPLQPGDAAAANARNRSVEVLAVRPSFEITPEQSRRSDTRGIIPPAVVVEAPVEVRTPDLPFPAGAPDFLVSFVVSGQAKAKIAPRGAGVTAAVAIRPDGRLSASVETKIVEGLKTKVYLTEASDKKSMPDVRAGVIADRLPLVPEIGVQLSTRPIYFQITLAKSVLPGFDVDGVHVTVEITGKFRAEVGPTPKLLARLVRWIVPPAMVGEVAGTVGAATAGEVGAVSVGGALTVAGIGIGVIAFAIVVVGGTIELAGESREEADAFVHELAVRDGAASQLAYELLGSDVEVAFREQGSGWARVGGEPGFSAGVLIAKGYVNGFEPERLATVRAGWDARFVKGLGPADYVVVRERLFVALGGYDKHAEPAAVTIGSL